MSGRLPVDPSAGEKYIRFRCPYCSAVVSRFRVLFSKAPKLTCPVCRRELEFETWSEKMRLLPYLLAATLVMELLRDQIPVVVRLALIFGPPFVFLPMVLRLRRPGA